MKRLLLLCWLWLAGPLLALPPGTNFQISGFSPGGPIAWTNAYPRGVCTVEVASQPGRPGGPVIWMPQKNYYTTNSAGAGNFPLRVSNAFFRLLAVNISTNAPQAYTNLLQSYGTLHTLAGNGDAGYASPGLDNTDYWLPAYEGGYATNAALSRPHFAMTDAAGNLYIVDKNSFAVFEVTLDGRIHTVAGTHASGNGPDTASAATSVALNTPNGLWVRNDGTVYILDTGNSKVRRLDTNGILTTLFTDSKGINGGRGLWVKDDESLIYYSSGTKLRQWTPKGGTATLNSQFNNLGTFILSGTNLVATDRDDNTVWLVATNSGTRTLLFGNGGTNQVVDGTLAATNSLYDVRGIWQPPIGGYFLVTDAGDQLLYVDITGIIHVLATGNSQNHGGDGQWFYSPTNRWFGQFRSVAMDNQGNLILVENDAGYVRRIDFQRLTP